MKLNSQPASVISRRLNINRSSTYTILSSLKQKGVISCAEKRGTQVFFANDPNALVAYLDSKAKTFNYQKSKLSKILPQLRKFSENIDVKEPIAGVLGGLEGISNHLYGSGLKKYTCHIFFNTASLKNSDFKEIFENFLNYSIKKYSSKFKFLVTGNIRVATRFFKQYPHENIAYKKLEQIENDQIYLIFEDQVQVISFNKGSENVVVIFDKVFANFQKSVFENIYNQSV
jgi:sugar-specific transcriptional regulator TrmB